MKEVDFSDVQGMARFGFSHLAECHYLLLRVRNPDAAREWLAAAPVTTAAARKPPPANALQVAFTCAGLRALGVGEEVMAGFSAEFLAGMAGDASRSRRLGDLGENAPENWYWGAPGYRLDALVILMTSHEELAAWKRTVCSGRWEDGFEVLETLTTSDLDGREPFGFIDGISQPVIDWDRRRNVAKDQLDYSNVVSLGELLLGYPNEYGKYTDRPLIDPPAGGASVVLHAAEEVPGKRDLGKNGTYLVFRTLEQDVTGFWSFLRHATGSPEAAIRLAEKMVGRTYDKGAPLAPESANAIEGVEAKAGGPENQFTYDADPRGTGCPIAAHIRRANPRNADLAGRPEGLLARVWNLLGGGPKGFQVDVIASTRFHRILRRGREYGQTVAPALAMTGQGVPEPRGLHFICLNANISRQFEFVQNAWIMSGKFSGLPDESDPLLGPAGNQFSMPRQSQCPVRITGLPRFVTVRGGAYFFLPGLRALRYIARAASTVSSQS